MNDALLETFEIETAPNPTHAVIWLHGLGADGHDFAPIVPELKLGSAPAIRFVFPHAPIQPVTINGGMAMRSWYDIRNADLAQREDSEGIRKSEQAVHALIKRENERGIATSNIVLAGFSQGCAITLHTGLRFTEKLAGLIALSGYLPLPELAQAERNTTNQNTPILMAHGAQDPVVPLQRAQQSCALLQQLGYAIDFKLYPMPHSVCLEEINDISAFLQQAFKS